MYFSIIQNNWELYIQGLSIFTDNMLSMFLQILLEDQYGGYKIPNTYPMTAMDANIYLVSW